MTGKTTAAAAGMTAKMTGAAGVMTGATGATTGKTAVVAGPGCSGNCELDDQGGHAAARSVLWRLQTRRCHVVASGGSGYGCDG
jgi:hypothetical protein